MLYTRALETKDLVRCAVGHARLEKTGPGWAEFRTVAEPRTHARLGSGQAAWASAAREAVAAGGGRDGVLRVEVLGEGLLRIRYRLLGEEAPSSRPSLVPNPPPPRGPLPVITKESVTLETGSFRVSLLTASARIEIRGPAGDLRCGIGGREKNNFGNWDAFNTGVSLERGLRPLATETFDLAPGEAVYGFGERFTRLNTVGQTLPLLQEDPPGATTPKSYKNIPFFQSSRGYGVFFNHSSPATFWVGSLSVCDVQAAFQDDYLDYFVFLGSPREILRAYTGLTGRAPRLPAWSFGFWQAKGTYSSAAEVLEVAEALRKHRLPCDLLHVDTAWFERDWLCTLEFGKKNFPQPEAFIRELRSRGFRLCLWQLPYLPSGTPLFEKLAAVGGLVKREDGSLYDMGISFAAGFQGITGCVDFTHPEAVAIYTGYLENLLRMGVAVIKTDFGEEAPLDGVYHDGTPGMRMRNLYPLLYNRAVFEVARKVNPEALVWARSAFAGSQAFPVHWAGDTSPNWHNLGPQIEGGLSLGLSGFTYWSMDIGGTFGNVTDITLLIRWMQAGLFLSHSRIHGLGDRELYRFGAEALAIARKFLLLRYRLLPYIRGSADAAAEAGLPLLRALVLDFPDDPTVFNISDQYLFGESLLVAPLLDPTGRRRVYFPAGHWRDWWSGEIISGPCWRTLETPLDSFPLYIREGGLIPLGPEMQYVGEVPATELEVRVGWLEKAGRRSFAFPADSFRVVLDYECTEAGHEVRAAFDGPLSGGGLDGSAPATASPDQAASAEAALGRGGRRVFSARDPAGTPFTVRLPPARPEFPG